MIQFYKPNKAIKGFACSFWYSNRDNAVYATILKQSGWDEANQNGVFKEAINDPTKKTAVKLSWVEVGGILDCIERPNRPFSAYHNTDKDTKQVSFTPWMTKSDDAAPTQKGYSFSVSVSEKEDSTKKNPFYIGFTFAEARLVREFLVNSMHKYFNRPFTRKGETAAPQEAPSVSGETKSETNADPLTDF